MSDDPQPTSCFKEEIHSNLPIKYICLEEGCLLNRLLCKKCLHECHRKHKVGIIDKLIQPLNRLNMHSSYPTSLDDYEYLEKKLKGICNEWEKLNQIFIENMEELKDGILFQLHTVMKTFTNEEVESTYEVLINKDSEIDDINRSVKMMNFLSKDYIQDVDAVKKFSDFITERVKKAIIKTSKKIQTLLKKMQEHIKLIDFNNYQQFKNNPDSIHDQSHAKEEKNIDELKKEEEDDTQINTQTVQMVQMSSGKVKKVKEEDDTQINTHITQMSSGKVKKLKEEDETQINTQMVQMSSGKVKRLKEEDDTQINTQMAQMSSTKVKKVKEQHEHEELTNRYVFGSTFGQKKGFIKYK